MRSIISVLAASLALAAGTGCGGDDDEPTAGATTTGVATATTGSPPPATTEQEDYARPEPPADQSGWAAEVDDACAPVQQQIDALPQPTDAASLATWLEQALPLIREQVAAVEGVTPLPQGDARDAARLFTESLRDVERALTQYAAALEKNDAPAAQQALGEAGAAGEQARTHASTLGVTKCGGYGGS